MKQLTLLISLILTITACKESSKNLSHKEFVEGQSCSAKDYVIDLFETHDIVILCERFHAEFTQYELFLDIVKDPYFIDNVGNVYTEVGVSNMNAKVNSFLNTPMNDSITEREEVSKIFREYDDTPYWHCHSCPWLMTEIHELNQSLPQDKKIGLHPVDVAFNWADYQTSSKYGTYLFAQDKRDSIMSNTIIQLFEKQKIDSSKRTKALVIMNYRHAFIKDFEYIDKEKYGSRQNVGRFLVDAYSDKVASVYIMGLGMPKLHKEYSVVQGGKWDAAFESASKTDLGFNLKNSPFGKDDFDVIPKDIIKEKYTYQDIFTGLIYYKPIQEHLLVYGWNGFVTEEFEPEMRRRSSLLMETIGNEMPEEEFNDWVWSVNSEGSEPYEDLDTLRQIIDNCKNGL